MRGAFALLAGLLLAAAVAGEDPKPLRFPPRDGVHRILVLRAVDGDTVHFAWLIEDTARLHGINTPETRGKSKAAGLAAKAFLETMLSRDPVAAESRGRDKYGRALLRLRTADGKDVSQCLIDAGHAVPYNP